MNIKADNDIFFTDSFMKGNDLDDYRKIYYFSNEKIDNILKNVNIDNKKILSVLASGDQAFHFYDRGAKKVDLFDKNKLTIYYYYLRRWSIIYLDRYYPNYDDLDFKFDIDFIKQLIKNVVPRDENEASALEYWKMFVEKYTDDNIDNLFYLPDDRNDLRKNNILNVSRIKKRLLDDDFIFYDKDFSWNVDVDEKYDLIYVSNIPEWIYYKQGIIHLEIFKYNLLRALNKGGLVLGTNISLKELPDSMRRLFRDSFSLKYIEGKNNYLDGYQYKKIIK